MTILLTKVVQCHPCSSSSSWSVIGDDKTENSNLVKVLKSLEEGGNADSDGGELTRCNGSTAVVAHSTTPWLFSCTFCDTSFYGNLGFSRTFYHTLNFLTLILRHLGFFSRSFSFSGPPISPLQKTLRPLPNIFLDPLASLSTPPGPFTNNPQYV